MSAKDDRLANQLIGAVKDTQEAKTSAYDTTAEVMRIDDDGATAWVHIPGGVAETPVQMSISAKVGDTVRVHVSGGNAWISGNNTAPPTDDSTAVQVKSTLQKAIAFVRDVAQRSVKQIEAMSQYFWHDSKGAHVSTKEGSTDGANALLTAAGLHIRDGATDLASFTRDGAQIGKDGSWHLGVESDGFSIYEGANRRYHVWSFSDTDPVESGAYMDSGDSRLQMYHSETTGSHTELLTTATNDTAIASMRATEVNYSTEQTKAAEVSKTWFGVTGDGDYDDSSSLDLSFGAEGGHHVFGVDNAGNVVADGTVTANDFKTSGGVKLSDLTPSSISYTVASNIKIGYCTCYKIGRLAVINVNFKITSATANQNIIQGLPTPAQYTNPFALVAGGSTTIKARIVGTNMQIDGTASANVWYSGSVAYVLA